MQCQMLGCEDPEIPEGDFGITIKSETVSNVEVLACDLCNEQWLNLKAYRSGDHESWLLNSHDAIAEVSNESNL